MTEGYRSSFEPEGGDRRAHVVPAPSKPLAAARLFLDRNYADDRHPTLVYHRGAFYDWDGTHWLERDADGIEAALYRWLEDAVYAKGQDLVPFDPSKTRIKNISHALGRAAYIDARLDPPVWLDGRDDEAHGYLALENGLLHLATRRLVGTRLSSSASSHCPIRYEPDAASPVRWFRFLRELWADDEEMISTLQEIFGYILEGGTGQQKIFLFIGPTRSGKGTIARFLQALLGAENVAGPTLSGLSTQFGMSDLIGKPLGTISDARLNVRRRFDALG